MQKIVSSAVITRVMRSTFESRYKGNPIRWTWDACVTIGITFNEEYRLVDHLPEASSSIAFSQNGVIHVIRYTEPVTGHKICRASFCIEFQKVEASRHFLVGETARKNWGSFPGMHRNSGDAKIKTRENVSKASRRHSAHLLES